MKLIKIKKNKIERFILPISKITIISFLVIFLCGFFFPYHEYPNDSRGYGLYAIRLVDGDYEFSSDLLTSTGKDEFVPATWIKTPHDTAIPDSMPGIAVLGAIFYLIGGEAGLFYLGPIFAICFLIASERIATKFFGPYVGLLTLSFLATNEIFFWVGRGLLTSNVFSLLFILGFYFMIKFLRTKRYNLLLLSSSLLMIPSFFRLNGIIILPIEITIIGSYFTILYIKKLKNKNLLKNKESIFLKIDKNLSKMNILKILVCILIPWIIFMGFFVSFNNYYFDDPTKTIYTATENPRISISQHNDDTFIDQDRMKKYLNHFLPYPMNRITDFVSNSIDTINFPTNESFSSNKYFEEIFGNNNLGIFVLAIILISLIISFRDNENRMILISMCIFIFGFIIFYSFSPIAINRQGSGRDILPLIPFFYMMLSYVIFKILKLSIKDNLNWKKIIFSKILKSGVILFLIIIIPMSFIYADYSQIIKNNGLILKDPNEFEGKFPVDFNGISKEKVIFTYYQVWSVVAYGAIPFTPSWDEGLEDEHYQNISDTLKETISKGKEVFIFKNPKLEDERTFYMEFFSNNGLILKDYSDGFCQIIIDQTSQMKSDKNCFQ
jgi:hypothetical protein